MSIKFSTPDILKYDEATGMHSVDREASEICCCLEALGGPKVYYAAKMNQYFKDDAFQKPFNDEELQALDLILPVDIETKRKRLIKATIDSGARLNMDSIYKQTMPQVLKSPKHIEDRIIKQDLVERTIHRINKATLGK